MTEEIVKVERYGFGNIDYEIKRICYFTNYLNKQFNAYINHPIR